MGENEKTKSFYFHPKMFHRPPFTECPKCKKLEFGRLSVSGNSYTKRCGSCMYSQDFFIPPTKKKTLYLDQLVVSNMTKALLKDELPKDDWFVELFRQLEFASKGQLLTCPYSDFHEQESIPFRYEETNRMYKHFAHGIKFSDALSIKMNQINQAFDCWRKGEEPKFELDVERITHGKIHNWEDTIFVTTHKNVVAKDIENYNNYLKKIDEALEPMEKKWKVPHGDYDYYLQDELTAEAKIIIGEYQEYLHENFAYWAKKNIENSEPDFMDLVFKGQKEQILIVHALQSQLENEEEDYMKRVKRVYDFLESEHFRSVPYIQIHSALWAIIRYQLSTGATKYRPEKSIVNDINLISLFTPYVDGIFIDRAMHLTFQHKKAEKILSPYYQKVYSVANKDKFVEFIKGLEEAAPKYHFGFVKQVYGENWNQPYYTMFKAKPQLKYDEE